MTLHDELIGRFVEATNASESQARHYLEAAQWDLNEAVSAYFSNQTSSVSPEPVSSPRTSSTTNTSRARTSDRPRMMTLQDILRREQEEQAEHSDEGETYYAGGEKSGTMMQGAPSDDGAGSLIGRILKKAAQAGPRPAEDAEASSSSSKRKQYFSGTGYRLGSDEVPSEKVTSSDDTPAQEEALPLVVRKLTFWKTGFTIDDGPLQSYDDPANKAFLVAINSGKAPLDRLNVKPGQPVELAVERRLHEDYKPPPPPPVKPFSGAGQRLGNIVPSVIKSMQNAASQAAAAPAPASSSTVDVDGLNENEPITTLQIRLADGSRRVARFNHTHTIGDLRQFISSTQSDPSRTFILQTTFPVRELKDTTQTLKEAGLLNSVVVQRYV